MTVMTDPELLIDRAMPGYDVTIAEHILVDADVTLTWRALCDLDLMKVHSPLLDAAFWARGLPERALRRAAAPPPELVLGQSGAAPLPGWVSLGRVDDHELALGAVGRFWTPIIEWRDVDNEEFDGFADPDWGKIAVSFSVRPYGTHRTVASYECRTATFDDVSRRAFARYWHLVRPFVGHVMRATLRQLAENAEILALTA